MSKRPELTAAERALPYAKFYDLPITPIPEEKLAVLAAGPIDPSLALKIEDRNDLFKPGYLLRDRLLRHAQRHRLPGQPHRDARRDS